MFSMHPTEERAEYSADIRNVNCVSVLKVFCSVQSAFAGQYYQGS